MNNTTEISRFKAHNVVNAAITVMAPNNDSQNINDIIELASLMFEHGVKNFLEIGTCHGFSFFVFSQIATNKKISIDYPESGQGISHSMCITRNNKLNMYSNQLYFIMKDSHFHDTYMEVKNILGDEKLDFLFIDGDHSYNGVKKDFMLYKDLVNVGGMIALHDIIDTPQYRKEGCLVSQFWNELDIPKYEIINDKNFGGIGVIINK